jgi:hexosaminidase
MERRTVIGLMLMALFGSVAPSNSYSAERQVLNIAPWPNQVEIFGGRLLLEGAIGVMAPGAMQEASFFAELIPASHGPEIKLEPDSSRCNAEILINQSIDSCGHSDRLSAPDSGAEGYRLLVTEEQVLIRAESNHGVQHALMTLYQMMEFSDGSASIPTALIEDQPRYSWRGFMIDSSRAFQPPDVIKKYLDLSAEFKLNVFHWHLTDDQGWRIESPAYPALHEVSGTLRTLEPLQKVELERHGWGADGRGYYTREEIADIVAHATKRHIMVVPEIDMPGHCSAWLAAYPELSCDGKGAPIRMGRGIWGSALCPGKEEVYLFIDGLLNEVTPLFPAPYFHVGGDEVAAKDWLDYPPNQEILAERGGDSREDLQAYFMERLNDIVQSHGKTMIAWDETMDYLPQDAIVHIWRKANLTTPAVEDGHGVIVSEFDHYLNYWPFLHTNSSIHKFNPTPSELVPDEAGLIMGGEACLWGHEITLENMDERIFPRLIAEAETLWTEQERKDFSHFSKRIRNLEKKYGDRGVSFSLWRGVPF